MDYELPTEFDLIVVGTGIVESTVSAAASRIGKRVLHLDRNNYYGGQWASFNLEAIQNLPTRTQHSDITKVQKELIQENEEVLPLGNNLYDIKDFSTQWHIPEKAQPTTVEPVEAENDDTDCDNNASEASQNKTVSNDEIRTQESLLKDSRKFNIDLAPKLQFAKGNYVELLISSNIARYSEYRSVSRVLTWLNGEIEFVPCSRSDVFSNEKVSVIEKRMLMKLFLNLEADQDNPDHHPKTFKTFLKEKKLTPNLIHYVLYAIGMCNDDTPFLQGVRNTKRFLDSLGRFGKTPFLFPMYGSGETSQAFCRLSAVFGGVYALGQNLHGLVLEKNDGANKFNGLICGHQRITADHSVLSAENAPQNFELSPAESYISRAVLITDKSVKIDEQEHLTLLLYPPENGKNGCTVIELGSLTGTCPKDLCLVHIISKQQVSPKEDLKHCVENLFNNERNNENGKPNILWSAYFSIPDTNDVDFSQGCPSNVHICPGPDTDLDYDFSVEKAKEIFSKIYPDMEFLPRAPDPEEIIIEGEETENVIEPQNDDDGNVDLKNAGDNKSTTESQDEKTGTGEDKGDGNEMQNEDKSDVREGIVEEEAVEN